MGREIPGPEMTAIFSALDHGEDSMVVTADPEVADWAERHGYVVRAANHRGAAVYEMVCNRPADPDAPDRPQLLHSPTRTLVPIP